MEEIKQAVGIAKLLISEMADDKELMTLNAKLAKGAFDAYIEQGFDQNQALVLTAALVGKPS